jgi:hypothetical protein
LDLLRVLYTDLVDELDLVDCKSGEEMSHAMTSSFNKLTKFVRNRGKFLEKYFQIDFDIRTATLKGYKDYNVHAILSKEDNERYKTVKSEIEPLVKRLEDMGFKAKIRDIDIKLDSWKYVTAGIKISITKN